MEINEWLNLPYRDFQVTAIHEVSPEDSASGKDSFLKQEIGTVLMKAPN